MILYNTTVVLYVRLLWTLYTVCMRPPVMCLVYNCTVEIKSAYEKKDTASLLAVTTTRQAAASPRTFVYEKIRFFPLFFFSFLFSKEPYRPLSIFLFHVQDRSSLTQTGSGRPHGSAHQQATNGPAAGGG